MTNKIPYETIYQAKMGNEEALAAILNHYEPQIVKASVRTVNQPDGSKQRIVDQEIKAYILSELAMKIMVKYDLNKKPSKRRPPQSGGGRDHYSRWALLRRLYASAQRRHGQRKLRHHRLPHPSPKRHGTNRPPRRKIGRKSI